MQITIISPIIKGKMTDSTIVLFSGGIDSTTALYWSQETGARVSALSIDYGQRHRIEIETAKMIPRKLGIEHKIFSIDLTQMGGSALTDREIPLPSFEEDGEWGEDIPLTYVPFRNGIFLAIAAAWADIIEANTLVVGFNVIDSPHYPDTRKEFVDAMQEAVTLGTRASQTGQELRIQAPVVQMKKSDIIREGLRMGADYSYSISCYAGQEIPCGRCSSCRLRQRAWEEVGVRDHLLDRLDRKDRP